MIPRRREDDLLIEKLPDETLVYDLKRHKGHCLNRTASWVWKHCDGRTTVAEMDQLLCTEWNLPAAKEIIRLALHQLDKARLLEQRLAQRGDAPRYSRRELARKACLAASSLVMLPAVITMAAPTPALAASCTPIGSGPCSGPVTCCPNNQNLRCCRNGSCANGQGSCI